MAEPIKTPASAATERILSLTNHLKNSLNPADDIQKAKMSASYKFHGWMGLDKNSVQGKMEWQEFEPKTWTEEDVDIKITHCGVCGSDICYGIGTDAWSKVRRYEGSGNVLRLKLKREEEKRVLVGQLLPYIQDSLFASA